MWIRQATLQDCHNSLSISGRPICKRQFADGNTTSNLQRHNRLNRRQVQCTWGESRQVMLNCMEAEYGSWKPQLWWPIWKRCWRAISTSKFSFFQLLVASILLQTSMKYDRRGVKIKVIQNQISEKTTFIFCFKSTKQMNTQAACSTRLLWVPRNYFCYISNDGN